MPFLSELTENKSKILQVFLSDPEFVHLVSGDDEHAVPALDLRYEQVFPYGWMRDTVDEAKTFVLFDIDVPDVKTVAVCDLYIYVWIFTHNTLAMTRDGVLVDRVASRVDELLNGNPDLGFGRVKLERVLRDSPNSDYYGRVLMYSVQDWNRHGSGL